MLSQTPSNPRFQAFSIFTLCSEPDSSENGYPRTKLSSEAWWGWDFAETAAKYRGEYITALEAWLILNDHTSNCFSKLDKRPSGPLKQILNAETLNELADSIMTFIESLPRSYSCYLHLAPNDDAKIGSTKIAQNIELIDVSNTDSLLKIVPAWNGESAAERLLRKHVGSEGVFFKGNRLLKVQTRGFVRKSVENSAVIPAISILKCALYLGALVGIFTHERRASLCGQTFTSKLLVIDETASDGTASKIEFDHDLAVYMSGYRVSATAGSLSGIVSTGLLKTFLDADAEDENRLPITTAAEWAFDSMATNNETVSFIQLSIALEAILGDEKDSAGLTKTLADRCAYLLGKTAQHRTFFREQFEKLYKHRSKIVHGRKVRLGPEARDSLYWGKWVLDEILKRELQNFSPARKKVR